MKSSLVSVLWWSTALSVLGACSTHPSTTTDGNATSTVTAPTASAEGLRLERVVMLMRHGVRPPTKAQVVPEGMHDRPWPTWSVGWGELTQRGYDAARLLGAWDRGHWIAQGLLPANGCPAATDIEVAASAKSRTQASARALVEGLAPGCTIAIGFPGHADEDVEFHPLDAGAMPIDADEALRAVQALAPPGGMPAEVAAHAGGLALLGRALGCSGARADSGCRLADMPAALVRNEGDRPDIGDPFGLASTVSQTFLLQYLEGMPMSDVAWGRLTRQQIEDLLAFHSMLQAMQSGPRLTVLVGHDTNIADLGGFLDLHWQVPSYPRDDPPPGGALGFEVLVDARGQRIVRAFYRAQTMDQVRGMQALSAANPPAYQVLPIPGCDAPCALETFATLVRGRLVAPLPRTPRS